MRFIVCVKQVPETNDLKIDQNTNKALTEGISTIINPFDQLALEQAISIRKEGDEIVAISIGDPKTKSTLMRCLALGADKAILLNDNLFQDSDTFGTANILASTIKRIGDYDLIFCGNSSFDTGLGQVGPELAALLDIPQITYVESVETVKDGKIRAKAQTDDGYRIIESTIPLTHYSTMTYDQMEQEGILDQIEIVDDRISPYENQGLVLEVLRIRHRGFLEKFLTRGNSWKDVPEFYYISYIDGMEFKSKDLKQHQQTREILINTWDSMFQESKVMRSAVQGQEKSHITLTIVEREKAGLLGIQSVDSQKDSFSLTYCYRTGRWTGDDSFRDSDGYGYYLGDTFEVWFNLYQPDYDDDYIPYWTEVNILGTDPTIDDVDYDPDGDGTPIY